LIIKFARTRLSALLSGRFLNLACDTAKRLFFSVHDEAIYGNVSDFMKMKLIMRLMVAGTLGGIASCWAQTKTPPTPAAPVIESSGPKIQFADIVYDFGKVNSGEAVKHDFVFTNIGTARLEIKDVRPGCGCTTAGTWDKQVEPGKTGIIPLQFNSSNFGGVVAKSATVTCNDPGQSNVVLQIKGTVWRPIDVTPTMAVFTVTSETQTNETKVVRIVSNLDDPLTLSELQCSNQSFKAELKTVKEGKEFELQITALAPFTAPTVVAPVTLKTSSPKMPTISVTAYVVVQQPVVVMPTQITLPAGPLAAAMNHAIMIRNSSTNPLVLSEAGVTVPGPEVTVHETQPGRLFNLAVTFPAGFQIKPGEKVEVTVKSNHPKFALIKVPVFQAQTPAAAAASPVRFVPATKPPLPVAGGK